jgi:crossover junction endodeoxyribonuclease RuvC
MLQHILAIKAKPSHLDATDALAVAICHHFQCKLPLQANSIVKKRISKKKNGWDDFIAKNPLRVLEK